MGIESYKVRAARLIKHLSEAFGLNLSVSQGLIAVAQEEGIPRGNWNLLAARAKLEPSCQQNETIIGQPGSGKTVYAKERIIEAVAAKRPVLIISKGGEYDRLVQGLGGSVVSINQDGSTNINRGYLKIALIRWDMLSGTVPEHLGCLKDLGFGTPEYKELFLVCDEAQVYVDTGWASNLLCKVAKHECATIMLVAQSIRNILPAVIAANAINLRIFKLHESVARHVFDSELLERVTALSKRQSIEAKIHIIPIESDPVSLKDVDDETINAVLSNTSTRIILKMDNGAGVD